MNPELFPALVALSGGAAALACIAVYEHGRDSAMRASRVRIGLRFPAEVDEASAVAVLRGLAGLDYRLDLLVEMHAREGRITHAISVPEEAVSAVESNLRSLLPGIRLERTESLTGEAIVSAAVFVPTPLILSDRDAERANQALLGAVATLRGSEQVVLRWALSSERPRSWSPVVKPDDREALAARNAWERKTNGAGLRAAGLILVSAESRARARELAEQITGVLRSRQSHHGEFKLAWSNTARPLASAPKVTRGSGWLTLSELVGIAAWPLGSEIVPWLERGGARERLVPAVVARDGRVLFTGRDAHGERLVALSPRASLQHQIVLGGTGSGKSTLMGSGSLDDIRAGRGGAVIDLKGDLVDDMLNRIDPHDADRIVVLDPADHRPTPGIDVFGIGDPDLRTDFLVGAFASVFPDSFGVRSALYLRLGIRTLAEIPGATLLDLPRLFADPSFRAQAVRGLSDPVMAAQWQMFDALSPAAQAEHVQSPMTKVSTLLSRPAVRAVLASADPRLDIPRLLDDGRWLLVSLSPGRIGEPAGQLLSVVLMYSLWAAVEGRAALPPEKRNPISLVVDEVATIAALPISLELLLERSRAYGAGVVLGLQSLSRVPVPLRAAISANVATFITFRAGADDAARVARELPGLTEQDVLALGRYEVGARIGMGSGSEIAVVTGTSRPWPKLTHQAERIRDMSSVRYGARPNLTRVPEDGSGDETVLGRTRRQS